MAGRTARTDTTYDVAVLGGHVASALLAAVLARQGVAVLLLDAGPAGHVPAGEDTVPYGAEIFALLADRFGLSEIAGFGHAAELPREVREVSGLKKNIGFLHHEEGREQDPRHVVQFVVPGEHSEWHLYRPAADEHAWRIAVAAGAATAGAARADAATTDPATSGAVTTGAATTGPATPGAATAAGAATPGVAWAGERPRLGDAVVGADAVTLTTEDGRAYRARFVVDGAGPESPLVKRLLGDDPGVALRQRSRR